MSDIGPDTGPPTSDVYTVLVMVASAFVLIATIVSSVRSQQLFGGWLPFGGG